MPIEIRELVIKTTVDDRPERQENNPELESDLEAFKEEVMKSCRRMIEKMMKTQNSR